MSRNPVTEFRRVRQGVAEMAAVKSSKKMLSEFSDSEMVEYISAEILGDDQTAGDQVFAAGTTACGCDKQDNELLSQKLGEYIAMLRGMQLWYHSAHHVTHGAGFISDHEGLYGDFYQGLTRDVDNAVERALGLAEDETLACPKRITSMALQVIECYPSPVTLTSLAIASTALAMEKDYIGLLELTFAVLENAGTLSIGLNDMLSAAANVHEGYIYKLRQRVKTQLED